MEAHAESHDRWLHAPRADGYYWTRPAGAKQAPELVLLEDERIYRLEPGNALLLTDHEFKPVRWPAASPRFPASG